MKPNFNFFRSHFYFLILTCILLFFSYQIFSKPLSKSFEQKLKYFLEANTQKSTSILSSFSDNELESFWNIYKDKKTLKEKRIFWLLNEYHSRKANKIATNRLIYLFMAMFLLFSLILIFLYTIISQQKKILSKL